MLDSAKFLFSVITTQIRIICVVIHLIVILSEAKNLKIKSL